MLEMFSVVVDVNSLLVKFRRCAGAVRTIVYSPQFSCKAIDHASCSWPSSVLT